jgi:hypothetical protein
MRRQTKQTFNLSRRAHDLVKVNIFNRGVLCDAVLQMRFFP